MEDNLISYSRFIKERNNFRKVGTDFNLFDAPGRRFFKILFYFYNEDSNSATNSSGGLLAPTWQVYKPSSESANNKKVRLFDYNSAWAFLKLNDENERAEKLQQFITLLSNISSESPWYFSEVTGVDAALERKLVTDKEFKLDETRQKISIKCLPDSVDNRIGKLMDLYRDIVFSWSLKKEIVPANLRKFDMGIYIFESPILRLSAKESRDDIRHLNKVEEDGKTSISHVNDIDTYGVLNETTSGYASSYKLIEFHNCEFDYNSAKSGYGGLNNKEGFDQEYTIDISFDDCYERRYDEFTMRTIGDVITTDTAISIFDESGNSVFKGESIAQGDPNSLYNSESVVNTRKNQLTSRLNNENNLKIENNLLKEAANQGIGLVKRVATSTVKHLYLGNLFNISVSNVANNIKDFLNGDVLGATGKEFDKVKDSYNNKYNPTFKVVNNKIGNIFKANTLANNL